MTLFARLLQQGWVQPAVLVVLDAKRMEQPRQWCGLGRVVRRGDVDGVRLQASQEVWPQVPLICVVGLADHTLAEFDRRHVPAVRVARGSRFGSRAPAGECFPVDDARELLAEVRHETSMVVDELGRVRADRRDPRRCGVACDHGLDVTAPNRCPIARRDRADLRRSGDR